MPTPARGKPFFPFFFPCCRVLSGRLLTSRLVFNQNPLLHPSAGTAGPEREFAPDREADELDDPDLGASALDDDAVGGGGETGGSGFTAGFDDWPDDDEADPIPRRQQATNPQGVDPSGGLTA